MGSRGATPFEGHHDGGGSHCISMEQSRLRSAWRGVHYNDPRACRGHYAAEVFLGTSSGVGAGSAYPPRDELALTATCPPSAAALSADLPVSDGHPHHRCT